MTTLYLIRHCEAAGNAGHLFMGQTDCEISETGEKQLNCLADRFGPIAVDRVYSSPLTRARRTAQAVAEPKGLTVETVDGLAEQHVGVFEARPFAECFANNPALFKVWNDHPEDFAPEGGESIREVYQRGREAITQIVKENPGKTVVAATHGGLLRCLLCHLLYGDITRLKNTPWSENTSVSRIDFDDSMNPTVVFMNDTAHLPAALLPEGNKLSSLIGGESL